MKVKDIEGYIVRPGETLVIVPNFPVPMAEVERVGSFAKERGFSLMVLPPQAKVYVVKPEPTITIETMEGQINAPAGNA
jgi:hypothetical protein